MFSDDLLMDRLVLKGGNALDIVHGITARGSFDIDFSIEGDFADIRDVEKRIFDALRDRFDSAGFVLFDERFGPKPERLRQGQDETWGGYRAEFKLISKDKARQYGNDVEAWRRDAAVLGLAQERVFRIEISKFEYVGAKVEAELDAYTIYVYPPEMIAAEKLRAICQQMPDYEPVRNKRARARDFYDIHTVITRVDVDLATPQNQDLVRAIFAAKGVPLALMGRIREYRDFHSPDWPGVLQSLSERAQTFDFYFDFVLDQVEKLKPLWDK
jgi:hypothetical protein